GELGVGLDGADTGRKVDNLSPCLPHVAEYADDYAFHNRAFDVGKLAGYLGPLALAAEQAVDDGKGYCGVDFEDGRTLQGVHINDGHGGRVRYGPDEFLVGKLIHTCDVHLDETPQLS